jgi:hypothetical protein
MRTLLICIACYFVAGYAAMAQPINLVPNGGFEDYTECSIYNDIGSISKTGNWFGGIINDNATVGIGFSTDYYNNNCADINTTKYFCVTATSKTGNAFTGLILTYGYHSGTMTSPRYPEYDEYPLTERLETGLLDTLKKDSTYTLSFWVKNPVCYSHNKPFGDFETTYKINAFQAYFTKDSFFSAIRNPTNPNERIAVRAYPQFDYLGPMVYDTTNWVQIKCNFVARGGERFMTIGNFTRGDTLRKRATRIMPKGEFTEGYYALIDDVELYPATAPCYYPREAGAAIPYVPPVPPPPPVVAPIVPTWVAASAGAAGAAQGRLVVQHLPPRSSLWLYDALGQLVYQSANYTNDYSFLQQNAAMYFYVLRTPTQTLKGKIIVNN